MKILVTLIILVMAISVIAQDISMTITQENLALIKETRSITLKKGQNSVKIDDLPSQLLSSSVNFFFNDQSVKLLEYNFEYYLQNSQMILDNCIGSSIRILHPDLGTIQGKLISAQRGILILETAEGELRIINDYQNTHFIIENSETNGDLVLSPTVFCSIESKSNLTDKTQISYLSSDINWATEYTAIIDDKEESLSLSTKAVISNYSGKDFQNCTLLLLAGDINRSPQMKRGLDASRMDVMNDMVTRAAESDFQESTSFEYHSYTLGRSITLEDQQQKILSLYPTRRTDISKIYTYHYQKDAKSVSVEVATVNSKDKGLGYPLPSGLVRIQKQDGDQLLILGEDNISHTPVGEEIKLKIGQAFDIMAERKVLDRKREGKNNEKMKISIEFRNRKNENIEIHVTEPVTRRHEYRILSSNIDIHKKDSRQIEFIVPVKSNQTSTLEYEILYTW